MYLLSVSEKIQTLTLLTQCVELHVLILNETHLGPLLASQGKQVPGDRLGIVYLNPQERRFGVRRKTPRGPGFAQRNRLGSAQKSNVDPPTRRFDSHRWDHKESMHHVFDAKSGQGSWCPNHWCKR